MPEGYKQDLARIHDAGFRDWASNASDVLIQALRERGFERGLVVDLGCGNGILSRRLVDAGFDVVGIDQSEEMIGIARAKVPEASFRVASFVSAELPQRAVGVAAVGEVFNYLFDEANDEAALRATFRRIHNALADRGVLLFDMAGPGRVPQGGPTRTFREGDDWAIMIETSEDSNERLLTRRMTTFTRAGDLYRRGSETHYLHLVTQNEAAEMARAAGFEVRVLENYGEMAFPPGLYAYLCSPVGSRQ